jgi:hypothetical protein
MCLLEGERMTISGSCMNSTMFYRLLTVQSDHRFSSLHELGGCNNNAFPYQSGCADGSLDGCCIPLHTVV